MKMMKKILASALVAAMLFSLSSVTAFASQQPDPSTSIVPSPIKDTITIDRLAEDYTYTITFLAGNQGILDSTKLSYELTGSRTAEQLQITPSADRITIANLKAGDKIGYAAQSLVTIKDNEESKIYYVKGFRLSGRDNALAMQTDTINVSEDTEYVVAYGIKGEQVKYTVKYQKENGESLASDDVFYGNIGDKPIVAYKYINGYTPKTVAFTKTLDQNEAENVFVFVYEKTPNQKTKEVVTEETEYNYVTVGGETIIVNGGGAAGGTASNVTGGGNAAGANAGGDDTTGEGTTGEAAIPGIDESQIVDLDDEETPLANIEVEPDEEVAGSSVGVYVGLGLLAVIIAAVVAYIVSKKRKIQE